ncbi:glycoside hydrolase [Fistulina hepatica ATCC 64428]|uniref:alpha-1,2-Mannosidase n=1 Tax=Fistulina hepatica ATCC 64428 TaxID=1128425 RepID=A0A0D7AIQ4_9AGAR|nr:glycoside hydrolase [Fistulina hepatica ATCC 64428]
MVWYHQSRSFSRRYWNNVIRLAGLSCLMYIVYLVKLMNTSSPPFIDKRDAIVHTFKNAWAAYERDAMGCDEYHPISRRGSNITDAGGIGYTILDAMDTMWIMDLQPEYARAREWVETQLSFDRDGVFSTFETTIRVLGGLLSLFHLTTDRLYLNKAVELADRILPTFDTDTGLPLPSINLRERVGVVDRYAPSMISTAEATTLQLEFKDLAEVTGNKEYWYKVEKPMKLVYKIRRDHNLVPIFMNVHTATFMHSDIRLGSRGDSYYEYLLYDRSEDVYRKMYEGAMQGLHDQLVQHTFVRNMTYIAELIPTGQTHYTSPKQDHLVCFLAGSLMLGATTVGALVEPVSIPPRMEELSSVGRRDWQTGVALLDTCMKTHEQSATGLSPEIAMFRTEGDKPDPKRDWYIKGSRPGGPATYDARYMLRPETIESIFVAWRLTGDTNYRDFAWSLWNAIEKYCAVATGGYATVKDVDTVPVSLDDKQETFFLSETLKYMYLTFANTSVLPLDEFVFNTEAHPLPIFKPTIRPRFS